jgi:hypothetical protein
VGNERVSMEFAGAVDMDGGPEGERMGIREWSRREAVRHRCAKAQAESENWGGRVNQLSGDDVGIRHDWVLVPFHLIEIISRLCCLVHLRIWNATKERNTDTAA